MRDIISLIEYEASRKPHIRQLIDNINTLSYEEIDKVSVPLPWYRNALRKLKAKNDNLKNAIALETTIKFDCNPDPIGRVVRCQETMSVKSGKFLLELVPEQLVFIYDQGMWVNSTFIETRDERLQKQPSVGTMSRTAYRDLINKEAEKKFSIPDTYRSGPYGSRFTSFT